MAQLYEEWLQCSGDWCKSGIYLNAVEKTLSSKRGQWVYMPYKDVVSKYGESLARGIRDKKKELQAGLQDGEDAWYCKHPEVQSEEAWPCWEGWTQNCT